MKKLLFIFFMLLSMISIGQTYQGPLGGNGTWHNRIDVDRTFGIPFGTTPIIDVTGPRETRPGRLYWKTTDNTLWGWTGVDWIQVSAGTSVTIYTGDATIDDEDRTVSIVPGRGLTFISQDDDEATRSVHAKNLYLIDYRDKGDGVINKVLVDPSGVLLSSSDPLNAHQNKFLINDDGGLYTGGITGQVGIAYAVDYSDRSPLTLVTNGYVNGLIDALNLQEVNTNGNETTLPIKFMGETGADKFSWLYGADNATRSGDPDFPDITGEFKWMLPRGNARSHLIGSGIEKRTLATSLDGVFADQYGDLSSSSLALFYRHDGFMYNDPGSYNPDLGTNEPDDGSRDVDLGDLFLKWTNSPGHYWETESALVKMWLGLPYDGWRVENPTGSISLTNAFRITSTTPPTNRGILDLSNITNAGMYLPRLTTAQRDALGGVILSGLQIFNTDTDQPEYWNGSSWIGEATPSSYVANVTGTTNRITVTTSAGPTKIVDIASTYVGQTSITTLGTIGTGTWQGSVIGSNFGGAGTVNGILKANGSGVVSQAVSGTDYAAASHTHSTTDITSGTLPIVRGGTGLSSLGTANQMLRVNAGATALEYFSPAFGTVTSVGANVNGDALAQTTADITTSGDFSFEWQGNANEYVNGEGNLISFPTIDEQLAVDNNITHTINMNGDDIGLNIAGSSSGAALANTSANGGILTLTNLGGMTATIIAEDLSGAGETFRLPTKGGLGGTFAMTSDLSGFLTSESDPVWTAASSNYSTTSTIAATYVPQTRTITPGTGPLSVSGSGALSSNITISISKATGSIDGYLAATDFTIFAAKQAALVSGTNIKTVNGSSLLGSGNLAVGDVLSTASNTYTAGMKQIFQANSTTAGLNFAGVSSDPSSLSNGDMWMNTTSNTFKYRVNATTRIFANLDESQTFTNKTLSGSSNTFSNIGNSSLTNSSITIAGNSTALGGSVTQDNITGLSSTGLVKRTAANTLAIATSGTDYAPATEISTALKGNGSGGFAQAASTDLSDVTEWTDYSGTSTITGFSSYTTKLIQYKKIGKTLTVQYQIEGAGTGTTCTFTLPFSASSWGRQYWTGHILNNNTTQGVGIGWVDLSDNTAVFSINGSTTNSNGWTTGTTRHIQGQMIIALP